MAQIRMAAAMVPSDELDPSPQRWRRNVEKGAGDQGDEDAPGQRVAKEKTPLFGDRFWLGWRGGKAARRLRSGAKISCSRAIHPWRGAKSVRDVESVPEIVAQAGRTVPG
ncbi:MAG: hypothetical protein MZW92_49350 [Comamonadaceae bacterium]|nr:hypothetical protein [Comamonadaceae bacterium]